MKPEEAKSKYYMFHYYTKFCPPHSYSLEEISTLLGIQPESLKTYIVANELPAEPVGDTYRITVEDIEDFLLAKAKGIVLRRERRCISV